MSAFRDCVHCSGVETVNPSGCCDRCGEWQPGEEPWAGMDEDVAMEAFSDHPGNYTTAAEAVDGD